MESKFILLFHLSITSSLNLLLLFYVIPFQRLMGLLIREKPSAHPGWNSFTVPKSSSGITAKRYYFSFLVISPCLHQTNRYITYIFYINSHPWLINVPILQVVFLLATNQFNWVDYVTDLFRVEYSNHHDSKNSKKHSLSTQI